MYGRSDGNREISGLANRFSGGVPGGKPSRLTHDTRKGLKALGTLSTYTSNAGLVLGQLGAPEKPMKSMPSRSSSATLPKPISFKERW
jgi:hypothetical protein